MRDSPIEGRGLFATGRLPVGTLVALLRGRPVSGAELRRLLARAAANSSYVDTIGIDDDLHLVLAPGQAIHHGNHSCDPTLWHDGPYALVARRDIEPGEELTVDYATQTTESDFRLACRCDTHGCRRVVTGDDWRQPAWQERYRGHVVPAVARASRGLSRRRRRPMIGVNPRAYTAPNILPDRRTTAACRRRWVGRRMVRWTPPRS